MREVLLRRVNQYSVGSEYYEFENGKQTLKTLTKIVMRNDGNGISGYYDVIYFYYNNEEDPTVAMPAHKCEIWEFLK